MVKPRVISQCSSRAALLLLGFGWLSLAVFLQIFALRYVEFDSEFYFVPLPRVLALLGYWPLSFTPCPPPPAACVFKL